MTNEYNHPDRLPDAEAIWDLPAHDFGEEREM